MKFIIAAMSLISGLHASAGEIYTCIFTEPYYQLKFDSGKNELEERRSGSKEAQYTTTKNIKSIVRNAGTDEEMVEITDLGSQKVLRILLKMTTVEQAGLTFPFEGQDNYRTDGHQAYYNSGGCFSGSRAAVKAP